MKLQQPAERTGANSSGVIRDSEDEKGQLRIFVKPSFLEGFFIFPLKINTLFKIEKESDC